MGGARRKAAATRPPAGVAAASAHLAAAASGGPATVLAAVLATVLAAVLATVLAAVLVTVPAAVWTPAAAQTGPADGDVRLDESLEALLDAAEQALDDPAAARAEEFRAPDFSAGGPAAALPPIQRPTGRPIDRSLDRRPAARWRLLDGDGVIGVMRLSDVAEARDGPVGFWVAEIVGRGIVEGVYNLKDDGRRAIGVFWPEGLINGDAALGFLDLRVEGEHGLGRGQISFTGAGASLEVFAR